MNKIRAFFKLIRWNNLLMIAIMMLMVYYCLMYPMFQIGIVGALPSSPAFVMLLISMIFIVAGGYVINDYFDVEIDKVNKPDKIIVSKIFSGNVANFFYIILTFVGLSCGMISSILILDSKFYLLFAFLFLLACLLHSYSANYKKKLIIGNLIVSISVAFAVFLPWLFEMLYLSNNSLILYAVKETSLSVFPIVLVYTAFAFLTTLIREIVKDAEDYKGDMITRCRTIPIVCGIKTTKIILYVLFFILYVLLISFNVILIKMKANAAICVLFVAEAISVISAINVFNAKESSHFHSVSLQLKVLMLFGIITMIFI